MALPSGRRPRKPFADAPNGTCRICGRPSPQRRDHPTCVEKWRWTDPKFYRPKILERDQNRCEHCGKKFADEDLQVDHILALRNGGVHGHPALYQTLCAPTGGGGCHREKSATEHLEEKEKSMGRRVLGVTLLVASGAAVVRYFELPYGYVVVWVALFCYSLLGLAWLTGEVKRRRVERHRVLHELLCGETGIPVSRLKATRAVWRDGVPVRVTHAYSPVTWDMNARSLARVAGLVTATYGVDMKASVTAGKLHLERGEHLAPPEPAEDKFDRLTVKLAKAMGDPVATHVSFTDDSPSQISVTYPSTFDDHVDARRYEVAEIVDSSMPGRWRLEWDTQGNRVVAHRRPEDMPGRIDRPVTGEQMVVPIGPDEDRTVRAWRPDVQAHLLVAGQTGGGKSVLISGVTAHCLTTGWEAIIADGKGTTLAGFRHWPGVIDYGFGEAEAMSRALLRAEKIMTARYREIYNNDASPDQFQPLLVVMDEATLMMAKLEGWWKATRDKGDPQTPPAVQAWKDIAVAGREARVHLVLGIQQAAAGDFDGTQIRDQFGCRIALGPTTPEAARMMFRDSHAGNDVPTGLRGRATVAIPEGRMEVQCYYFAELLPSGAARNEDDEGQVRQWRMLAERAHPAPEPEKTRPARVHELSPGDQFLCDEQWARVVSVDPAVDAEDDEADVEYERDGRHAVDRLAWDEVVTVLDSEVPSRVARDGSEDDGGRSSNTGDG